MASDIHKKRTGKGFRISEEIVMKEEMYEEEEEFFPRSCRLLGPHMQTASPEMNLRMEAYLTNRMAMSAMVAGNNDSWRQNDIHTQFAQFFPNVGKQAQQLNKQMYAGQNSAEQKPVSAAYNPNDQSQQPRESFSSVSSGGLDTTDSMMSPTDSTPKTPAASQPSCFAQQMTADSPPDFNNTNGSAFTAELPQEAKMLMAGSNMNMNDPFAQNMYGQDWSNNGPYYNFDEGQGFKNESMDMDMQTDYYGDGGVTPVKYDQQEINWGSFVNEDDFEQHQ